MIKGSGGGGAKGVEGWEGGGGGEGGGLEIIASDMDSDC